MQGNPTPMAVENKYALYPHALTNGVNASMISSKLKRKKQAADRILRAACGRIGGGGGYVRGINESREDRGQGADIWNWSANLAFLDVGREDAFFAIAGGMPPKATHIDGRSGDRDTSYIIERSQESGVRSQESEYYITPGDKMTIQGPEILAQLQWRYAVKQFDATKKVPEGDWHILEESMRLAPSSYGLQPWKFIIVQDMEIRKQLTPVTWNQSQVEDCSHYVVFATRTKIEETDVDKLVQKMAEVREVDLASLDNYQNMMVSDLVNGPRSQIAQWWSQRQSYIAMGMLMETAALLNIDTCPIEGLEPSAYDQILQLEGTGYATVAAVAVGYRSPEDKYQRLKKVRFDRDEVIDWR